MKSRFIPDLKDPLSELNTDGVDTNFGLGSFFPAVGHGGGSPSASAPPVILPALFPIVPAEAVQAQSAQKGSGGPGSVVAETSGTGITVNLEFDAAAMAAPQSFRTGIEQAASILSQTITDKITINIGIDYSGTGGGAAAGPDNGLFESYSTVRANLVNSLTKGDPTWFDYPRAVPSRRLECATETIRADQSERHHDRRWQRDVCDGHQLEPAGRGRAS
jgi:hypothetical protein